jgi:hypothetical protein
LNTKTYIHLLRNPQQISKEDMSMLASIIEKYPYFQSARALQLKGLKNENSYLYNDALKVTAAHTTDRDILFDYITSESFAQNEISQSILEHDSAFNDIEVVSEDVSELVSIEIDKQIKSEIQKAEAVLDPNLFERKVSSVSDLVELEQARPPNPTEESKLEDVLQINEPLQFTKNDTHSFSEWLQLTKYEPIERSDKIAPTQQKSLKTDQSEKDRRYNLIEKFIQNKPKLATKGISTDSDKKEAQNKNLATPFIQSPEALMTETLAKVYLQQKNYAKAIQAYKILILKYPEKSGSFADQIRAIKKLINKESQ